MAEKETLTTRVTKLEDLAKILLDAQIKTEETFRQLRIEADERDKRIDKRFEETDERIRKLVSAIGELIKEQDGRM